MGFYFINSNLYLLTSGKYPRKIKVFIKYSTVGAPGPVCGRPKSEAAARHPGGRSQDRLGSWADQPELTAGSGCGASALTTRQSMPRLESSPQSSLAEALALVGWVRSR